MTALKTRPTRKSVSKFIASIEHPTRRDDSQSLLKLFGRVTGHKAVLWGDKIVGYGSYHYRYDSGREGDWPVSGFSPGKAQLSLYVMRGFNDYEPLLQRLGQHRKSKSCLYITRLARVDMAVLEELLRQSVADMREAFECS